MKTAITDSTVLDCGHKPSPHSKFTTGYGSDEKGQTFCYECAAQRDLAQMREHGRIALYLASAKTGGHQVSNWPGSLAFPVRHMHKGRHNIARTRYDVWFTGPDNREWHGVQYGENTQICHCRAIKR